MNVATCVGSCDNPPNQGRTVPLPQISLVLTIPLKSHNPLTPSPEQALIWFPSLWSFVFTRM